MDVKIANKEHKYLWSTEKRSKSKKSSETYIVCVYLDSKTTEQEPIVAENLSVEDLNLIQIGVAL